MHSWSFVFLFPRRLCVGEKSPLLGTLQGLWEKHLTSLSPSIPSASPSQQWGIIVVLPVWLPGCSAHIPVQCTPSWPSRCVDVAVTNYPYQRLLLSLSFLFLSVFFSFYGLPPPSLPTTPHFQQSLFYVETSWTLSSSLTKSSWWWQDARLLIFQKTSVQLSFKNI